RKLDKRHLIIKGTATWTDGDITASNGATIDLDGSDGGGIFDAQCDKTINNPGGNQAAGKFTIHDGGMLKKSAGAGLTDIQMDVETSTGGKVEMNKKLKVKSEKNLSGIIDVNGGGTLTVAEGFEQPGGRTSVAGGTLAVLGSFAESGGTISVTGAGAAVSAGGATTVSGGTLAVQLAGTFTVSASFTQSGGTTTVMGSGSLLSVTGAFQQ